VPIRLVFALDENQAAARARAEATVTTILDEAVALVS
jgi:hypothetical protein